MVCECGHNKSEHISGLDYGRNGYQCLPDGFCDHGCMMYRKKTKGEKD